MINVYAAELEAEIACSSIVISHKIQHTITSSTTGHIEVFILFQDGSKLSAFEFLRLIDKIVNREKYRYQYMDSRDKEIFRYDNAPHHKSIASFPHHKHVDNMVYNSKAPSLINVLKEVESKNFGLL